MPKPNHAVLAGWIGFGLWVMVRRVAHREHLRLSRGSLGHPKINSQGAMRLAVTVLGRLAFGDEHGQSVYAERLKFSSPENSKRTRKLRRSRSECCGAGCYGCPNHRHGNQWQHRKHRGDTQSRYVRSPKLCDRQRACPKWNTSASPRHHGDWSVLR